MKFRITGSRLPKYERHCADAGYRLVCADGALVVDVATDRLEAFVALMFALAWLGGDVSVEALGTTWPTTGGMTTAYVDGVERADWLRDIGYDAEVATSDDCPPEAPDVTVVRLPTERLTDLAERLVERHPEEAIALYSSCEEAWRVQKGDVPYDSLPVGRAMAALVGRPTMGALGTEWTQDGETVVVYMHVSGRDAGSVVAGCKTWRGWGYDARPVDPRLAMDGTAVNEEGPFDGISHVVRVAVPVDRWESFVREVVELLGQDDVTVWPSFEEAREYERGDAEWDDTPQAAALAEVGTR